MDVTAKTLEKFREDMADRGLVERTQDVYCGIVARCARAPKGMTSRLKEDLSPKYLRLMRAALLAWAMFAEDADLLLKVKRLRLPPAQRVKPKVPFARDEWRDLVERVRGAKVDAPIRAVLFIIAVRGLRISDGLRIRRSDVRDALRTGRLSFEAKGRKRLEYDAAPIQEALRELAAIPGKWERVTDLIVTPACRQTSPARRGKLAYKRVDRALRRIAKGIPGVHAHRFRRTYATEFLRKLHGDPVAMLRLQQHMGWARPDTAMQYVDAVSREKNDQVGNDLAKEILG